jgi:lipopolysaccharide-induced tumor necrosis factor-alpha factor
MASAMYPEDIKGPPPYSVHDGANMGMPYQQQVPPPIPPANFGKLRRIKNEFDVHLFLFVASIPPPMPVYAQTTILHPMIATGFIGRNPVPIQCPRCHQNVVTAVQYENGGGTWLIAALICFFGGIFGCCLIPFCVPGCQDAVHSCPACRSPIGRRNVF